MSDNIADLVSRLNDGIVVIPVTPEVGTPDFKATVALLREAAQALTRIAGELDTARTKLFPYADATEISGLSWNGFYLIGDRKSIKELQRIENRASQLEVFRAAFDERNDAAEARALSAEGERDRLKEALRIAEAVLRNHPTPYSTTYPSGEEGPVAVPTGGDILMSDQATNAITDFRLRQLIDALQGEYRVSDHDAEEIAEYLEQLRSIKLLAAELEPKSYGENAEDCFDRLRKVIG